MLKGRRSAHPRRHERRAPPGQPLHETRIENERRVFRRSQPEPLNQAANSQLLGRLRELPGFVKENRIQYIYLSLPMASQPRILHVLDELKDTTASIYFVPDMFITDLIQGRSGTVCGTPVISVCESPFTGSNGIIKRPRYVLPCILALISPSAIIALASSGFPVRIFKQRRTASMEKKSGLQFRSMLSARRRGDGSAKGAAASAQRRLCARVHGRIAES